MSLEQWYCQKFYVMYTLADYEAGTDLGILVARMSGRVQINQKYLHFVLMQGVGYDPHKMITYVPGMVLCDDFGTDYKYIHDTVPFVNLHHLILHAE